MKKNNEKKDFDDIISALLKVRPKKRKDKDKKKKSKTRRKTEIDERGED